MIIYYRLSDGSYKKDRFPQATKENCLRNFLSCFNDPQDTMYLILDNVKDETFDTLVGRYDASRSGALSDHEGKVMTIRVERTNAGSSAASFRRVFDHALTQDDEQFVLFQEDDYWHLPGARMALLEGLDRAYYVSLYDHADTYIPASQGGNPLVSDYEYSTFPTSVIRTKSSHWRTVCSTTMTFATQVKTLREDADIWRHFTQGTYPEDFRAFMALNKKGRSLITPIPSFSTHCEPKWAAPGVDWASHMEKETCK